jgi:hypothetical protein
MLSPRNFQIIENARIVKSFFGTRPAFNDPGSRDKDGRALRDCMRGFDRRARAPKSWSQLIEENSEFEEIPADGKQRGDARTIRQTVPTNCSSAA